MTKYIYMSIEYFFFASELGRFYSFSVTEEIAYKLHHLNWTKIIFSSVNL